MAISSMPTQTASEYNPFTRYIPFIHYISTGDYNPHESDHEWTATSIPCPKCGGYRQASGTMTWSDDENRYLINGTIRCLECYDTETIYLTAHAIRDMLFVVVMTEPLRGARSH